MLHSSSTAHELQPVLMCRRGDGNLLNSARRLHLSCVACLKSDKCVCREKSVIGEVTGL